MSAISTAYSGVQAASQRFEKAAAATVRDASGGDGDIVTDLVGQIDSRTAFEANISVIKTADEMLGRLLDIKA